MPPQWVHWVERPILNHHTQPDQLTWFSFLVIQLSLIESAGTLCQLQQCSGTDSSLSVDENCHGAGFLGGFIIPCLLHIKGVLENQVHYLKLKEDDVSPL